MLVFTGDINLTDWYFNAGFGIGTRIANGFDPFHGINRNAEDVWIGNFEGVASNVTDNTGFAGKVFRVNPKILEKLNHFDIYGLANNHAMQHGKEAYQQTLDAICSYGSKCFGTKKQKSVILKHQDKMVSLTGMCIRIEEFTNEPSYWYNPEYKEIEKEINSLPENSFKVLYIHWGNEYINRPSSTQKKFAHWLIDIGFDLIIGMHPHVLQGFEEYNGKYIFYSLGNFIFEMAWEPTKIGALVKFDLETLQPSVEYIRIKKDCVPIIVEESNIPSEWRFENLNKVLKEEDNSEQYHAEINRNYAAYRRANHMYIINNMIKHPVEGIFLLRDFIKRKF